VNKEALAHWGLLRQRKKNAVHPLISAISTSFLTSVVLHGVSFFLEDPRTAQCEHYGVQGAATGKHVVSAASTNMSIKH